VYSARTGLAARHADKKFPLLSAIDEDFMNRPIMIERPEVVLFWSHV
jgi:hypothetical protein